jgi:hypothetical protein
MPLSEELVHIVVKPYQGNMEHQHYVQHIETEAARLLELLSQDHACEMGWKVGGPLRDALAAASVRGQRARSMVREVVQRIAACRDSAKPVSNPVESAKKSHQGAHLHMQDTSTTTDAEVVSTKEATTTTSTSSSMMTEEADPSTALIQVGGTSSWGNTDLNEALHFMNRHMSRFSGVGEVNFWNLLATFQCEGDGSTGNFACAGAFNWANIASSGLLVISSLAAAIGAGFPVVAVFGIAGKIVELWGGRSPGLPEFVHDVLLMLQQAVDDLKTFSFKYDIADALAKSIVLTDQTDMVKRAEPIEDCDAPTAVAWYGAVDRVDEETAEAMASILSQAELAMSMPPDDSLALNLRAINRHIELFDGFMDTWNNLAMGRLTLLVEAANKSAKCERFHAKVTHRMTHTLLGSSYTRYGHIEKQLKVVRDAYQQKAYALEVQDIRYAVEGWFFSSWFDPTVVAKYSPQLVQLGNPGREFIREFLTNRDWAVTASVFEMATLHVLSSDRSLIEPLANDFAQVLLWSTRPIEEDMYGDDLTSAGRSYAGAAYILEKMPVRDLQKLKGTEFEENLREILKQDEAQLEDQHEEAREADTVTHIAKKIGIARKLMMIEGTEYQKTNFLAKLEQAKKILKRLLARMESLQVVASPEA